MQYDGLKPVKTLLGLIVLEGPTAAAAAPGDPASDSPAIPSVPRTAPSGQTPLRSEVLRLGLCFLLAVQPSAGYFSSMQLHFLFIMLESVVSIN